MKWLVNGRLFDGELLREGLCDLVIDKGRVAKIAPAGRFVPPEGATRIDLDGRILAPGFIDLHAHLRDPGQEWREDIISGSRAAAAGGFATVVAMPNTDPPIDRSSLVRYVLERGQSAGAARVLPAGSVTKGRHGQELAEMWFMANEGAAIFTDDGLPVSTAHLLRTALLYADDLGMAIMEHPEELSLTKDAQVNDGPCAARSGLKGAPKAAELIAVERGIALAKDTGAHLHLTHLSAKESLEAVRRAKKDGINITCDVTPHHLTLDESLIEKSGYSAAYKVNPPLRTAHDLEALWEGLADGTVDAIATDHAPYHLDEKDLPFQEAASGIASLECAVAVVLDAWLKRGKPFGIERLLRLFTAGPASVLRKSDLGRIEEGSVADITALDIGRERRVEAKRWESKARITPWEGAALCGWPVMTMREGKVIWVDGDSRLHAERD
ncbi:dihydroorotase [Acetomicrobium sp. S15 = DSM 107314]|jgi:dihydroorotase|uniref:dihydroorotase n=1 Tax=Acetomicrobium sp. S15 = DSM 107314 TaxID=2529858 RepID=UPI0018E1A62D|nr:dihydroorotase [Acetomicrobium sp. S15 = DSM 107314]